SSRELPRWVPRRRSMEKRFDWRDMSGIQWQCGARSPGTPGRDRDAADRDPDIAGIARGRKAGTAKADRTGPRAADPSQAVGREADPLAGADVGAGQDLETGSRQGDVADHHVMGRIDV